MNITPFAIFTCVSMGFCILYFLFKAHQYRQYLKKPRPKWKLEPDGYGTYDLYMWSKYHYELVGCMVTEESAKKRIKMLERDRIYLND